MKRVIFCLTLALAALTGGAELAQGSGAAAPALALLEQKYFEHSFDGDPVSVRVARLEKLIYGDTRSGNISDRLANIVGLVARESETPITAPDANRINRGGGYYAPALAAKPDTGTSGSSSAPERVFNYKPVTPFGGSSPAAAPAPAPVGDSGDYSNYPHITALENEILGASYPQDALPVRLARLETSAFGKSSAGQDLGSRTDALEQYAETKLHKKAFGVNPRMQENSDQMLPEISQSTAGSPPAPRPHVDAPEVFAAAPPPSSTQMLTRVGWCEYQLFGHTFPNMHLMARLRQLHDEVVPNKMETNLQLLDDMDALTNAVVARVQQKKTQGK